MPEAKKTKKGPSLPPKPALFTEDEWALAHSVSRLLELLAAPDAGGKDKLGVSKQKAALWLWQLLGSDPEAKEEAGKAKAAEVIAKLITTPAADASLLMHALGCLEVLLSATPGDEESKAPAALACEAVIAAKPPLVPWLLRQLEQPAGTGVAGAALGVLHALLLCAETRPLVSKVIAGWNQHPLVAALTDQQSMPLLGGRNASAHAAGILELLCTPPATAPGGAAAAAAAGGGSGPPSGSKGDAKQSTRVASASSKSRVSTAASAGGGGDASLAAVMQLSLLAAGGLPALLKVCTATGSTVSCRCSAVNALYHILATHGHTAATKQELLSAHGLIALVQVMVKTTLPLSARAAAAGCIYHYLAPAPNQAGTSAQPAASASGTGACPSSAVVTSKPSSSPAAAKHIIQQALQQRRQQQQHAGQLAAASSPDGGAAPQQQPGSQALEPQQPLESDRPPSTSRSSTAATEAGHKDGSSTGRAAATAANETVKATKRATPAAGAGTDPGLPAAPGDAAAALAAAQHEALLAHWDLAARKGLTTCAGHVVSAGAIPALLLLCCGLEVPDGLLEAAVDAAARGVAGSSSSSTCTSSGEGGVSDPSCLAATAAAIAHSGSGVYPAGAGQDAKASAAGVARRASVSAGGAGAEAGAHVGEALGSIAEPSAALEGEEEDASTSAEDESSRGASAESAPREGGGKKAAGKKAKKKGQKPAKLDPDMQLAQTHASAAVNLLALAGDASRLALLSAGALPVLLPLLEGGVTAARWNARQALLALSLVATCHSTSSSSSTTGGDTLNTTQLPTPQVSPAGPAVKLPNYISLNNMPACHWQPLVPPSMPPQPPLPSIPGRSRGDGGAGSTGGRPTSVGRRTSVSNLAASQPAVQSSRMSSASSFMDGPTGGAAAGGTTGRATRGPRTSAAVAVSATAAIAAMQIGVAGAGVGSAAAAAARSSVTAGAGPPVAVAEQQQQ